MGRFLLLHVGESTAEYLHNHLPEIKLLKKMCLSACDTSKLIFLLLYQFIQPETVLVSSSSGVQMEHQGFFTLSVPVRCLIRSGQEGILSIKVIYEWPY